MNLLSNLNEFAELRILPIEKGYKVMTLSSSINRKIEQFQTCASHCANGFYSWMQAKKHLRPLYNGIFLLTLQTENLLK